MALTTGRFIKVGAAPADGEQPMADFALLTAIVDLAPTSLPTNGTIAALTFSATPTQAEAEALRDECENLRDALAATITGFNEFKAQLEVSTGAPIFEDS